MNTSKYHCNGCKRTHDGVPHMTNATGSYCKSADNLRLQRVAEARIRKREALGGRCRLCGVPMLLKEHDPRNFTAYKTTDTHCLDCNKHRKWIARCLKFSDEILREAQKTKERLERKASKVPEDQDDEPEAAEAHTNGKVTPLDLPLPLQVDDQGDKVFALLLEIQRDQRKIQEEHRLLVDSLGGLPGSAQ